VTLGGTVVALRAGGRESRRTRHLAYAGFGAELVYIYVQYLGSMLGSASFFLLAGLVLALGAGVIRRFERRFAGATAAGTGS
jgi:uncharacterized membrane protein